jgi:hypothetical protein
LTKGIIAAIYLLVAFPLFAQVPSRDPAGIFDGKGGFSDSNYRETAAGWGTAKMIAERFGSPSNAKTTTTQPAAVTHLYRDPSQPNEYFDYSLGTPTTAHGDFSTTYAQVAYVFDPDVEASIPGVDGIETIQFDHNIWSGVPELNWAMGAGHHGHPTLMLRPDLVAKLNPFGVPRQPVEVVRAYGAGEDAACSYMVFQSGQIACGEGGTTAKNEYFFKPFPTDFTPTAASVTNNGEFLLVTGWNTTTLKGQLAVIVIGSYQPKGAFWNHEWNENYPGFFNYSFPKFTKLLGIIDLPGMRAPTMINAVGNWEFYFWHPHPGEPGTFPLSVQANWQCFSTGFCSTHYDTGGFALIGSRYERRILLYDLTPLFQTIKAGMFTTFTEFQAHMANIGLGAGQWPPTFAENHGETPRLVKTIDFPNEVTAVSASVFPDNRALIATLDGLVHIWDVDGLQTGGTGANAHEVSTVATGSNTTRLVNLKHTRDGKRIAIGSHWSHLEKGWPNLIQNQWLALSRGTKTVSWIDFSSGTAKVIQTMTDSRLIDPITVEDSNTHGTQADLLTIADYGAKDVKSYRYGPVIEWTTPPCNAKVDGTCPIFGPDTFEYEGAYATPTGPFSISAENVP